VVLHLFCQPYYEGRNLDWCGADDRYAEALACFPESAAAAYLLGMGCFSRGAYKASLVNVTKTTEANIIIP